VTADHGDALYDRGIYGHPQHYMYDELLSVPLVVRVPGEDGERISRPFSLGWLHELVSQVASIDSFDAPLSSEDGNHLLATSERALSGELIADSISDEGHTVAAFTRCEKFISATSEFDKHSENLGGYNRCDDPKERSRLLNGPTKLIDRVQSMLVDPKSINAERERKDVDEETSDLLKQLGYTE
jgi:choline-sulfatase